MRFGTRSCVRTKIGARHSIASAAVFAVFCQTVAHASAPALPAPSPLRKDVAKKPRAAFGPGPLAYLESLKGKADYLAPSQIDPRFTIAMYANVAPSGPRAQRMWFLQRDGLGGAWRLALWDERYWRRSGFPKGHTPPYSWKISSGYRWRSRWRRSGPTPVGVFGIDERRGRVKTGWIAHDIVDPVFLDLHYSGGRRSGVAFHGTLERDYHLLGTIASHGCIRMTQANAKSVIERVLGLDGVLEKSARWGEVPRFWKRERGRTRIGYRRDGVPYRATAATVQPAAQIAAAPNVLTKVGYRALAVFFKDAGADPAP